MVKREKMRKRSGEKMRAIVCEKCLEFGTVWYSVEREREYTIDKVSEAIKRATVRSLGRMIEKNNLFFVIKPEI